MQICKVLDGKMCGGVPRQGRTLRHAGLTRFARRQQSFLTNRFFLLSLIHGRAAPAGAAGQGEARQSLFNTHGARRYRNKGGRDGLACRCLPEESWTWRAVPSILDHKAVLALFEGKRRSGPAGRPLKLWLSGGHTGATSATDIRRLLLDIESAQKTLRVIVDRL